MEIKDTVSAATEVAKTAKEVLPQTTEQTDGALATLVGWFNNVVLYPVKKYSLQGTTQGNGLTGGVPPVRFSI